MLEMITKEAVDNKICLFCASDYHLEMLLIPYIVERIDNSKFVIITQNNLEETLKTVLSRINIDEEIKQKVVDINWNKKGEDILEETLNAFDEFVIIINGEYEFIKQINNIIDNFKTNKISVVDCFHIGDVNVDIQKESQRYKYILNTRKI